MISLRWLNGIANWENSQEKSKNDNFSYSARELWPTIHDSSFFPLSFPLVLLRTCFTFLIFSFFPSFSRLRSFYLVTSRCLGKSLPLFISPLSLDHSLAPLLFLSLLWTIYSFLFACHQLVHPVPSLAPSNILVPFPWNIFPSLNSVLGFWSR